MNSRDLLRVWGRVLAGKRPSLSIEITKECPLRCPGCYAYGDDHLSNGVNLRQLSDKKGEALIQGVLDLVDHYRPLHLSIVGGDPLVRFRELEILLPILSRRDLHVQVVTSAFREIPKSWAHLPNLSLAVSVDGLQPEHDARRKPATYARILRNIEGHKVTIHCTITSQMVRRAGSLQEFLEHWCARKEVRRVWMSFFTPQRGELSPEILSSPQRSQVVRELLSLRTAYPKLEMSDRLLREFLSPPASPQECLFARTTQVISADLKTQIKPCQFGGDPDCSQCGCIASMGLAALGRRHVFPWVTLGDLFNLSVQVAKAFQGPGEANRPSLRQGPNLTQISLPGDETETQAAELTTHPSDRQRQMADRS